MRTSIPTGEEWKFVAGRVGAPEGYVMPCYLALGYPAEGISYPEQEQIDPVKNSSGKMVKSPIH